MNNVIKGLPLGSLQCSLDIWLLFCTVRKRQGQIFKGVVLKAPDMLCEEIVILLEQGLEHHRLHQMCVFMLSHFSRVQLFSPRNCSLPDSFVHWILQARILEWIAISFPRGSSQPRDQTQVSVSCIGGWVLYHQHHLGSPASGEQHFTMMWTHRIACLMGLLLYFRFLFMGDCTFAEMMSS